MAAEEKVDSLERERQALAKKLTGQTECTKNAEKDMRLMYKRHKKEMQVRHISRILGASSAWLLQTCRWISY